MAIQQTLHNRRRILYAMIETTPGTYVGDAALFVAANAQLLQAKNIKFAPTVATVERDPDGISLQPIAAVHGQGSGKVTFESAVFASGTAGTAPAYSALLKGCFLKETVVAVTSVTYTKDPNSLNTLSIGCGILQEDGTVEIQWAIAGARGNVVWKADKIGSPIMAEWTFDGKLAVTGSTVSPSPVQAAMTSLTFANEVANVIRFWQFQGTPTGIFNRQVNNFALDFGTKTELASDTLDAAGYGYALIGEDKPTIKVDPAKVPKTIVDDVSNYFAGTTFSSSVALGATAGKRLSISAPNCQLSGLGDSARGVVSTWDGSIDLRRTPTGTASDAVSVQFT